MSKATKTFTVSASFEYDGFSDYWGGNGRRWNDNAGCLFAYYDETTTLRDLVDQWVSDFCSGGDCDSFPEDVTADDVRAALLDMLSDAGRADYESGALSEFAIEYAAVNGLTRDADDDGDEDSDEDDDRDDWFDCGESPVAIVLIEVSVDEDDEDCDGDDE